MNSEWNIRACADQCMRCQRKFADKENLMSRLCFAPEGYLREDFCGGCWPERATPTAVLGALRAARDARSCPRSTRLPPASRARPRPPWRRGDLRAGAWASS